MKLKFVIPSVLVVIAAGVLAFNAFSKGHFATDSTSKQEVIADIVGQVLEKLHYSPKKIDDAFSEKVFDGYIKMLDGEKKFFFRSDMDDLKKYETLLDDEIKGRVPLQFYKQADSILDIRMENAQKLYPEILSHPFVFTATDSIELDRSKLAFPADKADRKQVWEKMLKYRTLNKLLELKESQKKAVDTAAIKSKSEAQLEADARKAIKKSYDLYFDRIHSHYTDAERFSDFINVVAGIMDPHTNYFSPEDSRYFDEQMSGTFFGIGALLTQSDYYVKIQSIVTGGPAWKQGDLKAGDLILKVGQGDQEPVDMTGYTTQDAVKIIRGKKGTIVKLTVKHLDGTIETISIERDEVKVEAIFAHSYVINQGQKKIGFLVLPEFYFSPKGTTGPGSSAYDVKQELKKLKAQHVDGIVLDLRFNGGGSLGDAIDMAGLFIPDGPVVQVRAGNGEKRVLKDRDPDVVYSGPLAIMVNEYSASASEILSAAMQDYKRAVIIGSKTTFGKGTVQRKIDLSALLSGDQKEAFGKLGALKLTIQKFYRISGGSTQLRGVSSDITLPDPYYEISEGASENALPWDKIAPADYTVWKNPVDVAYLKDKSQQRLAGSRVFSLISKNIDIMKRINDEKKVSLNLQAYKAMQDSNSHALQRVNELDSLESPLRIVNLQSDMANINKDSVMAQRNREMLKAYKTDPYLHEAVAVMHDMFARPAVNGQKLTRSGE